VNETADLLTRLPASVRVEDIVDMLAVALILYFVVGWFRQSRSRAVPRRLLVIGVPLLVVLFLSIRLHLPLLESLVRLLTVTLFVSLAIVFQSDIRRMVDRLGAMGTRTAVSVDAGIDTPGEIIEAVAHFAETRTGALIAVRGHDPWDSFLHGGVELGGLVSKPLLYSIFAPDTPGHDGALLVEGDRVTAFGVHLPLSDRPTMVDGVAGTRHAAALGLAEECDALVIVVSEETGAISIARNGEIVRARDVHEARAALGEFWTRHYRIRPDRSGRIGSPRSFVNVGAAAALAAMAWLLFVFDAHSVQRAYTVPVTFRNVPPGWVADAFPHDQVRVVLTGPDHFFDKLDPSRLVVAYDLSRPIAGTHVYPIAAEHLGIPRELTLAYVDPPTIQVKLHRYVRLEVPVEIHAGNFADSLVFTPDRRTVTLLVPEDGSARPDHVTTAPIEPHDVLPAIVSTFLDLPEGTRLPPGGTPELRVRVDRKAPRQ